LEARREHPLDLVLPGLLLQPPVLEQLPGAADVLVVELDAHVAGEPVAVGVRAGEPDELGLGNGHPLALEGEVDRALLDDRVDVVAPGVVVHQDVDRDLVLLVQAPSEAADPAGRLAVAGEEHAVVAAPELVLRETVPLGALLDEQDEVGGAAADLDEIGLHDRRHRVAALAQARAVHPVAVVAEDDRPHDAARVLRAHVELLAQRGEGHLEILDERVGLVLVVEGVLVRALHGVLGSVVDLAQRGRELGPLQLGERVRHQDRLHELLRHADVEEGTLLLPLAHLDDAALLVEVDVGEAAHRDEQRGVLGPVGRGDHRVRHADELLLDHAGRRGLLRLRFRHGSVYLFPRFGAFALGLDARAGRAGLTERAALAGRAGLPLAFPRAAALPCAGAGLALPGRGGSTAGAAAAGSSSGRAGASPSGPSGVTMMEWGRPSGPLSRPRIASVRVPPVRLSAIFCSWILSFSLGSLPPFNRPQASTTSSMYSSKMLRRRNS